MGFDAGMGVTQVTEASRENYKYNYNRSGLDLLDVKAVNDTLYRLS